MDNFYHEIKDTNINPKDYDFDHPKALDFKYVRKCLMELLETG